MDGDARTRNDGDTRALERQLAARVRALDLAPVQLDYPASNAARSASI